MAITGISSQTSKANISGANFNLSLQQNDDDKKKKPIVTEAAGVVRSSGETTSTEEAEKGIDAAVIRGLKSLWNWATTPSQPRPDPAARETNNLRGKRPGDQ